MCAPCEAWVAARYDPAWKAPKGAVGRVPRRYGKTPQAIAWSGKTKRRS